MSIKKKFYVIFLDDVDLLDLSSIGQTQRLAVANKEFGDWPAAKRYADSVASSRLPQIVSGFGAGFPDTQKVSTNG